MVTSGYGEKTLYLGCAQEGAGAAACMTVVTPESTIDPLTPTLEDVATVNDLHYCSLC